MERNNRPNNVRDQGVRVLSGQDLDNAMARWRPKRSVRPATRETLPQRNPVQEIVTADELREQTGQISRTESWHAADTSERQTTHNGYPLQMRVGHGEMRHRNRRSRKKGWY